MRQERIWPAELGMLGLHWCVYLPHASKDSLVNRWMTVRHLFSLWLSARYGTWRTLGWLLSITILMDQQKCAPPIATCVTHVRHVVAEAGVATALIYCVHLRRMPATVGALGPPSAVTAALPSKRGYKHAMMQADLPNKTDSCPCSTTTQA